MSHEKRAHMTKYAIVTGAASGIGRATAYRLADEGYEVALVDLDSGGLEETSTTIAAAGGEATPIELNLADEAHVVRAMEQLIARAGAPSVLVNNAGVGIAATVPDTTLAQWNRMLTVNLTGAFLMARAVLPSMLEAGTGNIVNVSSVAGVVGVANRAGYCASKAGLLGLTRALAVDHAAAGIRTNAICPGTVDTEWIGKILSDAPDPEATREKMNHRQLDGRMGTPQEVAAGIAFLVSDDARFVNGSAFMMDGGMSAV